MFVGLARIKGNLIVIAAVIVAGGCSGSDRLEPADIRPETVAQSIMSQYDKNTDGGLDKDEIKNSALTLKNWDINTDGKIQNDEVIDRLAKFVAKSAALTHVMVHVTLNNRDLANAEVVFEPESFMGDVIQEARATTLEDGFAIPAVPELVAKNDLFTGVQPGLYRIRVTHPDVKIPAKYNTDTTMTYEASPIDVFTAPVELKLRK